MSLTVYKPFPGVVHVACGTQSILTKAFMRLQEFYESCLSNDNGPFRGRHFERREFEIAYAKFTETDVSDEESSYYDDWNGFNVPGDVVDQWLELFVPDSMEEHLVRTIRTNRLPDGRYYVIGTHEDADSSLIDHELSHAFWHLDQDYRMGAFDYVCSLPQGFYMLMNNKLREMGYCDEVLDDEITAYLSTDNLYEITEMLESEDIPWGMMFRFQKHFYEYKDGRE